MNNTQKAILVAMAVIVVGMLLYPPYQFAAKSGMVMNMGYGWIFSPPSRVANVNVPVLLVQWVAVAVVGMLTIYLTRTPLQAPPASLNHAENADSVSGAQEDKSPVKSSRSSQTPEVVEGTVGPVGIGGWLSLLILGMMVLGPLFGFIRINADISTVEHQYPELTSIDQWRLYKLSSWLTFLIFSGLGFYGGWRLARSTTWITVKLAIAVLWIIGPVASLVMSLALPVIIFGASEIMDPETLGGVIGTFVASIIGTTIWTAYLLRSRRVRNTYTDK